MRQLMWRLEATARDVPLIVRHSFVELRRRAARTRWLVAVAALELADGLRELPSRLHGPFLRPARLATLAGIPLGVLLLTTVLGFTPSPEAPADPSRLQSDRSGSNAIAVSHRYAEAGLPSLRQSAPKAERAPARAERPRRKAAATVKARPRRAKTPDVRSVVVVSQPAVPLRSLSQPAPVRAVEAARPPTIQVRPRSTAPLAAKPKATPKPSAPQPATVVPEAVPAQPAAAPAPEASPEPAPPAPETVVAEPGSEQEAGGKKGKRDRERGEKRERRDRDEGKRKRGDERDEADEVDEDEPVE